MDHVVIGTGAAGIHAAEVIRRLQPEARITMIGDEPVTPYCRPMISMVLDGSVGPERLPIRSERFFEERSITPVLGRRATAIDVENRTVAVGEDRRIPFDRLLIATGADPRPIRADNLDLDGIFYMRTAAQVRGMLAALSGVRRALVLGGGLVGFKAASALLGRGIPVTQLIRSDYPLAMQVDRIAGTRIRDELTANGLDVRVGLSVTAFEGNGRVRGAVLSDGSTLPCELVVIGKGVLPALSFVPRPAIDVDLGVVVDPYMETRVPGIFAAGDAAEGVDIARRRRWVNALWPEAVDTGMIAGANMAGRRVAYRGSLSRNVIRIFGLDVLTAGMVTPTADGGALDGCETLRRTDPRRGTYRKLVFLDDRLVGCVLVNEISQGGVLQWLIASRTPVTRDREALLAPDFNYGRLIPESGRPPTLSNL